MQATTLDSTHPSNEFAPSWSIPLHFSCWDEPQKIDTIRKFLIDKEPDILALKFQVYTLLGSGEVYNVLGSGGAMSADRPPSDGLTGLGLDSVTAKFGMYNLLGMQLPELEDLLLFLRMSYINFMCSNTTQSDLRLGHRNSRIRDCHIVCWLNILRKGQSIEKHAHGINSLAYLSGHVSLDTYPSTTNFYIPYDHRVIHRYPNIKGTVTIFPSYLPHNVDVYEGDGLRVTLGFDLYLQIPHVLTSLPFMNDEIFIKQFG